MLLRRGGWDIVFLRKWDPGYEQYEGTSFSIDIIIES